MTLIKSHSVRSDRLLPHRLDRLGAAGGATPGRTKVAFRYGRPGASGERLLVPPTVGDEASPAYGGALEADVYARTVNDLVRKVDQAGQALIENVGLLVEQILQRALGDIDYRDACVSALQQVAEEQGLKKNIEVHAGPQDMIVLAEAFAGDREAGEAPRYILHLDPGLGPGEIVLISPLGRIKAGPANRTREVLQYLRATP